MEHVAQVRPGFVMLALRRRWRILVAGLLVGLALGTAGVLAAPTTYTSQASLFLNPVAGNPYQPDIGTSRSDQLVALETEASLVGTPPVAALARERSTLTLPAGAEDAVKASVPSNSQVLRVSFSAGRPEVAAAGAQAFAEGYLEYRRGRAQAANEAEGAQLQQQLDATSAVLQEAAAALAQAAPGSSNALLQQEQLQVYATQLAQLNLQLTEVRAAIPATGEVLDPATAATAPSGYPPFAIVAAATLAMLGLAVVIALAREHGDDRVRDSDELTAIGLGHALATVPTGESAIQLQRVPPAGYRLLLTMISNRPTSGAPVVCVLGADQPETAMAVAAGLAASAHRLSRRTLLVETPTPQQWRGAHTAGPQLVGALADPSFSPSPTAPTVLRVGADEVDTEQVVLSPLLTTALDQARRRFDLVVLFGGSGTSAAGRRFAELADLTLVVATLGQDKFADLLGLVQTLEQAAVEDLCLVAAQPPGSDRVKWRVGTAADSPKAARATGSAAQPAGPDKIQRKRSVGWLRWRRSAAPSASDQHVSP